MSREGPVARRPFLVALVAILALRIWLATLPGYAADLGWYKRWALAAATSGLATAYETTDVDYPPVLLYPLWAVGKLYLLVEPGATYESARDATLLTVLVKSPHLGFDLLLAWVLYGLVVRGTWGASRTGRGWARLAALTYLANPAVLWDSAYWGQPDGAHSALALAALAALGAGRSAAAGALGSAAALTKPLAAPLAPLMVWAVVRSRGARGLLRATLGALGVAVLAFLPFLWSGRLPAVLRRVLGDVEAMPYTSVNAHNLWWILGGWRDANAVLVLGVTPKLVGLALFGVAYAALLLRLSRRGSGSTAEETHAGPALLLGGAAVASAFFFLSTHMHENHLFLALPLLLAVAGRGRDLTWLATGCSLAVLLNTVLHDPDLPYRLPGVLGAASPVTDPFQQRPYTWLQVVGSFLDTVLVAVVAGGTYLAAWRGRAS